LSMLVLKIINKQILQLYLILSCDVYSMGHHSGVLRFYRKNFTF